MRKLVVRSHHKCVKGVPRVHPVVAGHLGFLLRDDRRWRLASRLSSRLAKAPRSPVVSDPKLDLSRAPEHRKNRRLNQTQVITLDPELIDRVWNLKRKGDFVCLYKLQSRKPSLESICADTRPNFRRYLPPDFAIALFHKHIYPQVPHPASLQVHRGIRPGPGGKGQFRSSGGVRNTGGAKALNLFESHPYVDYTTTGIALNRSTHLIATLSLRPTASRTNTLFNIQYSQVIHSYPPLPVERSSH